MTLDLAARNARRFPAREALWVDGGWLTYGDLDVRATRLAARLHAMGVQAGDRIGILALNHVAHFDLLLAAPKLGFIYTPFNHRLSMDETRALFDYVRPRLLLVDAANAKLAQCFAGEQIALQDYKDWLAAAPRAAPTPVTDAETAHMLLFTGGSTGTPKGALIPYRQTRANIRATVRGWGLKRSDCAIQATPCFHAALNVYATPLLAIGARIVLMPAFEPGAYLQLMQQHGATRLFMVPTMYRMLAEHADFATADFSRVRGAISGGAPCPPSLRELFAARGIAFKQGFGMTEAGVNCFAISEAEAEAHPLAVGHPLPQLQAVVRHADGTPCVVDEVGELTLRGPQVCSGYFEREREWAECYRDGWLWTGDLARVDARGLHFITGRRKEMFISGGENVYPAEVEAAVAAHPAVVECAVLAVPHSTWGEVGLAAVALREGAQLDAGALSTWLKAQLAGYKRPRAFLMLPALPKTGAGKFNKPEIRRLYEARQYHVEENPHAARAAPEN